MIPAAKTPATTVALFVASGFAKSKPSRSSTIYFGSTCLLSKILSTLILCGDCTFLKVGGLEILGQDRANFLWP